MSIFLMIFCFNVVSAFMGNIAGRPFWCGVNIVSAVLMALMAMAYEGRLLNRVKKLEEEIKDLKRRF